MKKILAIVGGLVVLIIAASALASGGSDDEPNDEVAAAEEFDETDSQADAADKGTKENPYQFGESHSRSAGLLGASWTISIDEVRTGQPVNALFSDEANAGKTCTAVLGTATLDELDSDELISNPFSFPNVTIVGADGSQLQPAVECEISALEGEGFKLPFEIQLTPGATAEWMRVYLVDDPAYQLVAIEDTVYAE